MRIFRGRSFTIAFVDVAIMMLLLGFLGLSAYAAYEGIHDLILIEQPRLVQESWQRYYIMGAVALLTLAMWVLLEVALRRGTFGKRSLSAVVYVVLALWSIGFGYGFWWKVIASRADTASNIDSVVEFVGDQVERAERAVTQLENDLGAILKKSAEKQAEEETKGSSCGVPSNVGRGTFFKLRSDVTARAQDVHSRITQQWIVPLKKQVELLSAQRKRLAEPSVRSMQEDERRLLFRNAYEVSRRSANIMQESSTDLGAKFKGELEKFAADLSVRPGADKTSCYDPALAGSLIAAARAAGRPVSFVMPDFSVNEGAAATAHAFNKVWGNVFWAVEKTFASLGLAEVQTAPRPMQGRDVIALVASIVVDICIFVFTLLRSRKPLEASHLFQTADAAARAKLKTAIRAFEGDDAVDARRVFDGCILRDGPRHYFILPSLAGPVAPSWRASAAFLQNILVVLEEVRAIDKSYDHTGVAAWIRNALPVFGMRRQFQKAAAQLTKFGWSAGAEDSPGDGTDGGLLTIGDVSLHRFRRTDLLELLLLVREADVEEQLIRPRNRPGDDEPEPHPSTQKAHIERDEPRISYRDLMRRLLPRLGRRRSRSHAGADDARFHYQDDRRDDVADYFGAAPPRAPHRESRQSWWRRWRSRKPENENRTPSRARGTESRPHRSEESPLPRLRDVIGGQSRNVRVGPNRQEQTPHVVQENGLDTRPPSGEGAAAIERTLAARQRLETVFQHIDALNIRLQESDGRPELAAESKTVLDRLDQLVQDLDNAGLEPTVYLDDVISSDPSVEIGRQPSERPVGTVLKVLRSGFRDKASGQVVRRASVIVSGGPRSADTPATADQGLVSGSHD